MTRSPATLFAAAAMACLGVTGGLLAATTQALLEGDWLLCTLGSWLTLSAGGATFLLGRLAMLAAISLHTDMEE